MKTLLEILGISSLGEKEKKVLQRLRDEAVQEKANDELSESAGEGISDTLDALREERIEKNHSTAKNTNRLLPPVWSIGFACIICVFFLSFLFREKPPPSPATPAVPAGPLASSNQRAEVLGWAEDILDSDTPSFVDSLPLPSEEWLAKPKIDDLHAMLPIDSIASVYDELSQPPLPHFEMPALSDPALELYLEEGRRFKKDLQNGFGFMVESIASIDIGIEG